MTTADRLARGDSLWLLLTQLRNDDFGGHPACADEDPELFFPFYDQADQIAEAKAVCASCPIRQSCEAFADKHNMHGVWGGTTETERARNRRAAGRKAAA